MADPLPPTATGTKLHKPVSHGLNQAGYDLIGDSPDPFGRWGGLEPNAGNVGDARLWRVAANASLKIASGSGSQINTTKPLL